MNKFLLVLLAILALAIIIIIVSPQARLLIRVLFMNLIQTTSFTIDDNDPTVLNMTGAINSRTFDSLKEVVKENPSIKTIHLVDVPGSLNDDVNIEMCYWVRKQGLNTYLSADSHVASGGTDFFLAGRERRCEKGAQLGVHSWRDALGKEAKDIPKDDPQHEMNRKYIEDMLGTDAFYWYTIYAAPGEGMHYMTDQEIEHYNISTHN